MGNIFLKSKTNHKIINDLHQSLIITNLEERVRYLEDKLDNLDNDFYTFRGKTNANIKVMSQDIHILDGFKKRP